jgi:hypothetical protein
MPLVHLNIGNAGSYSTWGHVSQQVLFRAQKLNSVEWSSIFFLLCKQKWFDQLHSPAMYVSKGLEKPHNREGPGPNWSQVQWRIVSVCESFPKYFFLHSLFFKKWWTCFVLSASTHQEDTRTNQDVERCWNSKANCPHNINQRPEWPWVQHIWWQRISTL